MENNIAAVNAFAVVVLVGVTWWYASSTASLLRQAQAQTAAIEKQAAATRESLEWLHLGSLPEWDLGFALSPDSVDLDIQNNGFAPARSIRARLSPDPPGHEQARLLCNYSRENLVVQPGEKLCLRIESEDPPYEGELILESRGRWGLPQLTAWRVRVDRDTRDRSKRTFRVFGNRSVPSKVLSSDGPHA